MSKMVKVEILRTLVLEIKKKFSNADANKILDLIYAPETNPKKGKLLGVVGGILIKEVKYKTFRFYFLADGFKMKFISEANLVDILLKFVRMSDKKNQQKTIEDIKKVLRTIGPNGFK